MKMLLRKYLRVKAEGKMRMERPGLRWLEEAGKDLREMNAERWRQKEGDSEEWATVGGPLSQASGRAGRQVS
jgi:hypothetical protein